MPDTKYEWKDGRLVSEERDTIFGFEKTIYNWDSENTYRLNSISRNGTIIIEFDYYTNGN